MRLCNSGHETNIWVRARWKWSGAGLVSKIRDSLWKSRTTAGKRYEGKRTTGGETTERRTGLVLEGHHRAEDSTRQADAFTVAFAEFEG